MLGNGDISNSVNSKKNKGKKAVNPAGGWMSLCRLLVSSVVKAAEVVWEMW